MSTATSRRTGSPPGGRGERSTRYVGYVYALAVIWGLGDVASTFFAAAATGAVGGELNPLMRVLLATDPVLVLVLKAAVVLVAAVALLSCRDVVERVPGWRVWFATMLGAGTLVVVNNALVGVAALA